MMPDDYRIDNEDVSGAPQDYKRMTSECDLNMINYGRNRSVIILIINGLEHRINYSRRGSLLYMADIEEDYKGLQENITVNSQLLRCNQCLVALGLIE
jgi:hypothetical protein